jgi:DUF1365 family protein
VSADLAHHALYEGRLWHRRGVPLHRFSQRLTMALVDLDRLDELDLLRPWLSSTGPALAQLSRRDLLGGSSLSAAESLRRLVADELGVRPEGRLLALVNLRTWGWCFNPLSLYLCFDEDGALVARVLRVSNTPWHEHHDYVLDARGSSDAPVRFAKEFHVSPFLPMALDYELSCPTPAEVLDLRIAVDDRAGERAFEAGFKAQRRPLDAAGIRRLLVRSPTQAVSAGIYAQAVKLWRKGASFHSHPARRSRRQVDPAR